LQLTVRRNNIKLRLTGKSHFIFNAISQQAFMLLKTLRNGTLEAGDRTRRKHHSQGTTLPVDQENTSSVL